jgi:hypothetical protein
MNALHDAFDAFMAQDASQDSVTDLQEAAAIAHRLAGIVDERLRSRISKARNQGI